MKKEYLTMHQPEREFSSANRHILEIGKQFANNARELGVPYAIQGSFAYALNVGQDYRPIHDIDVYVAENGLNSLVDFYTGTLGFRKGDIINPRLQNRINLSKGDVSIDLVPAEFDNDNSFTAFTHAVGPIELVVYFPSLMLTSARGISCLSTEGNFHRLRTSFSSVINGASEIPEHSLDLYVLGRYSNRERLRMIERAGHGYYLRTRQRPEVRFPIATNATTIGSLMSLGNPKVDSSYEELQKRARRFIKSYR